MLPSNIDRLGGAKDDLRNHLLPPLLNSMNAYVTTDEKSSVSKSTKAPFQVVTVVDPAILSSGAKDTLSSFVWRRQNLDLRRYSSLSESVFLRTPKSRRTPDRQHPHFGKRGLSTSARERTSFKNRVLRLKEIPLLRKRVERLRKKLKVELEAKALAKRRQGSRGSRGSLGDELKEGNTSRKRKKYESPNDLSREILYEDRPLEADNMSKSMAIKGSFADKLASVKEKEREMHNIVHTPMTTTLAPTPEKKKEKEKQKKRKRRKVVGAIEGGFAAKLASVRQKEKEIDNIVNAPVKKKKKKVVGPVKFKANLRDFTERIAVEGTDYVMEMHLAPVLIENTRKYNIDINKAPKIVPNSTTAADMRDEYSTYCGQRKSIKNWLFYV